MYINRIKGIRILFIILILFFSLSCFQYSSITNSSSEIESRWKNFPDASLDSFLLNAFITYKELPEPSNEFEVAVNSVIELDTQEKPNNINTVLYEISTCKEIEFSQSSSLPEEMLSGLQISPANLGVDNSESDQILDIIQSTNPYNAETVIGSDNRTKVSPTTSFPWRTICKLEITAQDATNWMGSGAIIDENHVLTCGHNVYLHDHGGWASSIRVIPGKDGASEPYGDALVTYMRTYNGWINNQSHEYDWAVITLDTNIGLTTGWMGRWTADPSNSIYTGILNTAGYPGDLDSGQCLYRVSDNGRTATEYNHWYYMDTYGGQSGSPVWWYNGTDRFICTVHAYGDDGSGSNHGTRLNRDKYDRIIQWLDEDKSLYPDMIDRGEVYAGFSPINVRPGLTNFNIWCDILNMGNGSSRTFTVSYYASTNTIISVSDYLIGTDTVYSISPSSNGTSSWFGTFPGGVPSGNYYIGWIIDSGSDVLELNESNNVAYISSYQVTVDSIAPSNPSYCDQLNGSTVTNLWQNSINSPIFNWSGAYDTHSGIAGYYYYWGSNPFGTSSSYTTLVNYTPTAVTTGTYYLRIRSIDNVGIVALSWTTLYIFKYDSDPPETDISYSILSPPNYISNSSEFSLSSQDFSCSGVNSIFYQIDGGTSNQYTIPFDLNGYQEGLHTISFWGTDNAGNIEPTNYIIVYLDNTAPLIISSNIPSKIKGGQTITLKITCDSPNYTAKITIKGVERSMTNLQNGEYVYYWNTKAEKYHSYPISITVTDQVGNIEIYNTVVQLTNPFLLILVILAVTLGASASAIILVIRYKRRNKSAYPSYKKETYIPPTQKISSSPEISPILSLDNLSRDKFTTPSSTTIPTSQAPITTPKPPQPLSSQTAEIPQKPFPLPTKCPYCHTSLSELKINNLIKGLTVICSECYKNIKPTTEDLSKILEEKPVLKEISPPTSESTELLPTLTPPNEPTKSTPELISKEKPELSDEEVEKLLAAVEIKLLESKETTESKTIIPKDVVSSLKTVSLLCPHCNQQLTEDKIKKLQEGSKVFCPKCLKIISADIIALE